MKYCHAPTYFTRTKKNMILKKMEKTYYSFLQIELLLKFSVP